MVYTTFLQLIMIYQRLRMWSGSLAILLCPLIIGVSLVIAGLIVQKKYPIHDDEEAQLTCNEEVISSDMVCSRSVLSSGSRANFCTACGTPITPKTTVCLKCGKQV
ncbi:MAG: hypothetical protein FWD52_04390 [Candidatus Bathyarchaeota archaeon]|nr:hypothetical protein [Candidatus Termiticorpusculum sp.]